MSGRTLVVFSASLPANVEQHLSGEQQHHHLPHPNRHHLTALHSQAAEKGDHHNYQLTCAWIKHRIKPHSRYQSMKWSALISNQGQQAPSPFHQCTAVFLGLRKGRVQEPQPRKSSFLVPPRNEAGRSDLKMVQHWKIRYFLVSKSGTHEGGVRITALTILACIPSPSVNSLLWHCCVWTWLGMFRLEEHHWEILWVFAKVSCEHNYGCFCRVQMLWLGRRQEARLCKCKCHSTHLSLA